MSALRHGITCFENGRHIGGKIGSRPLQISPPCVSRNLYYQAANPNSWRVNLKSLSLADKSLEIEAVANVV